MATKSDDLMAEEITAQVFSHEALKHCKWDSNAAVGVSAILRMVLKANVHRKGAATVGGPQPPAPSRPVGPQPVVGKA